MGDAIRDRFVVRAAYGLERQYIPPTRVPESLMQKGGSLLRVMYLDGDSVGEACKRSSALLEVKAFKLTNASADHLH